MRKRLLRKEPPMLSRQLLDYAKKPVYTYDPSLKWSKIRPAGGEVSENVADQFVKAQGEENAVLSLNSAAVRNLLKAEVNVEHNVVLAYHADEAKQQMDDALDQNLGPKWHQSEYSMRAPEPGDNNSFFSASCGGHVYNQSLSINSKDQQIELVTRGKDKDGRISHALRAHYDPASGEIMADTVTSDYNWGIRNY